MEMFVQPMKLFNFELYLECVVFDLLFSLTCVRNLAVNTACRRKNIQSEMGPSYCTPVQYQKGCLSFLQVSVKWKKKT